MSTDCIEKKVLLRAPLERVWRAVSDATEFGAWFGVKFDGPFSPGNQLHGVVKPTVVDATVADAQRKYEGMPFDITVEQMKPESLFSFRWHPYAIDPAVDYSNEPTTLVVFALEQVENGVLVTITESGFAQIQLSAGRRHLRRTRVVGA
jgi:uncharacterized protein YndB with AHSA1/START domain